jgi:hypothetical protein
MEQLYRKKPSGRYEEVENKLSLNEEIMFACSIRYCMGRMTYVVGACIEECYRLSPLLSDNFKHRVAREIQEDEDRDNLGMNMDKEDWTKLKDFWKADNKYSVEANYHNTDRWSTHIAFKHNDLYYSLDTQREYHTVRNIQKINDNETI